jgi:hypothetical protein
MDSMNGQHGNGGRRDPQAGVLSVLLSILASKRVVLDRQQDGIDWPPVWEVPWIQLNS